MKQGRFKIFPSSISLQPNTIVKLWWGKGKLLVSEICCAYFPLRHKGKLDGFDFVQLSNCCKRKPVCGHGYNENEFLWKKCIKWPYFVANFNTLCGLQQVLSNISSFGSCLIEIILNASIIFLLWRHFLQSNIF